MQSNFLIFVLLILFVGSKSPVLACLSITDDFNLPDPTLQANFDIVPDLEPFTECWRGALRIRSRKNNWRLVANRRGPVPQVINGQDHKDNVSANDITLELQLRSFGMAPQRGAVLIPPFHKKTNLSKVGNGTYVVAGLKKSGRSCLPNVPQYYRLVNNLCLFRDFVYNPGNYHGRLSYTLIAP